MADNIFPAVWQVLDGNGDPVAGAKAYFYDTGTTNARTVYSDSAGLTPHASPLVADGDGVFPEVFVTGGTAVKVVVKTSADVDVYTQDPVTRTSISSGASGISFTPTAEIAQTNVQDAIEQVQTNLDTGAFTNITASGNVTVTGSLVFGGTTLTDTTGADTKLVSGTEGTSGNLGSWNGDGDMVDSGFTTSSDISADTGSTTKLPTVDAVETYVTANTGGMTLLGTLTTTSGASQSLTSLDLSGYKMVFATFNGVSHNSGSSQSFTFGGATVAQSVGQVTTISGFCVIDLTNSIVTLAYNGSTFFVAPSAGTVTTASTSIAVTVSGGSFDAGSIIVYGVK